jgi:hypothetical protein
MSLLRFSRIAVAIVTVSLAAGCGPGRSPAGQPPVQTVTAQVMDTLKADFNRAAEQTRVVLLLSPT